jgi:nucleoside-diphosphate-sugar epimerase
MRIFITGRNGFIATNLNVRFQKEGHIVDTSSRGESVVDKLTSFQT